MQMARIRNLLGDITDLSNEIASLSDDDDDPSGEAILKKSVRDANLKELFDQSNSCWKQHTRLIIHDDSRTYTRTSIRFRLEDGTTLLSPKDIRDVDKVYVEPADPIEPCKVVFDETVDFALVFSDVSYLLVRFLSGRYYLFDTSYSIRKWNPATNGQVAATGPDPPSASPNPRCASPPGWQVASAHLSHSACDVLTCDLQPWLQSFLASASSTGGAMGSTGRAPPLPMTIATTVVPNLETFVEILGVVPAQRAVGAALRQHWVDAQQAPFFYIARDVAGSGGMRWAVGRGAHLGAGPWLSPTPRFAVAVAPVSSTHELGRNSGHPMAAACTWSRCCCPPKIGSSEMCPRSPHRPATSARLTTSAASSTPRWSRRCSTDDGCYAPRCPTLRQMASQSCAWWSAGQGLRSMRSPSRPRWPVFPHGWSMGCRRGCVQCSIPPRTRESSTVGRRFGHGQHSGAHQDLG